ncbi:MAG: FAD-dependent oxidoreductase [Deltaproteobacteria bacterium]|nr:FAD-dependent oxidoreductase [Deltaproteobacteria bacterium]
MEAPASCSDRDRDLALGWGFRYRDLFLPEGLRRLYERFVAIFREDDPGLADAYSAWTADPDSRGPVDTSTLIVRTAPHLSRFLGRLFGIQAEQALLLRRVGAEAVIQRFGKEIVRRRVLKRAPPPGSADIEAIETRALRVLEAVAEGATLEESDVAPRALALHDLEAEVRRSGELRPAAAGELRRLREALGGDAACAEEAPGRFVAALQDAIETWLASRPDRLAGWISARAARPLDHEALVRHLRPDPQLPELLAGPVERRRQRGDFKLTDPRMDARNLQWELDYCVLCHERDKDSCSKGLRHKDGSVRPNPLGIPLAGCPLDEKIGEMNALRQDGDSLAALATAMIDNPMLPGTGHRICNDCMKACVYQRQDPVDIPQIETAVLTDVLAMPWGLEVYSLLTRWNPLDVRRPFCLPYNGKNVLVVGLGPAGYTLAQHLVRYGFGVVGIDGLKIEPLPEAWVGRPSDSLLPRPIRDFAAEVRRELDERVLAGFGGVAEYGITARWDKNFLTVLHIVLARHRTFRIFGGVRFGGTLTLDDAWQLGFDHVAIAAGAGKPTIVPMKNNLARGVRKASDFLMALQLTGASRVDSLANLQLRLPAVVIGGGLTAIDAATEALAYYVVQAERFLARWEAVGEARLASTYDAEERELAEELLGHGRQIRAEKERARREGRAPRLQELLASWGGVTIAYRRTMKESPAYRLNHEEIIKGLEEGVRFLELASPTEIVPDEWGAVRSLRLERQALREGKLVGTGETIELPARAVLVAAGTSPNVVYEREHPGTFRLDARGQFFQAHRMEEAPDGSRRLVPAQDGNGFFTSFDDGCHHVTFYGDNHPRYAGSVVKAMASARDGSFEIRRLFDDDTEGLDPSGQPGRDTRWARLAERLDDDLSARVVEVIRLTPSIVEVVVRAPAAARRFQPGQFYRLQNFEATAPRVAGRALTMEGIALTGAWVDVEKGLVALIVLEMGGSSRLCAALRPGEPVVLMGPTGAPTEIPRGEDVVLVGGGLGNAVLFSIGRALRNNGCRVLYFAGYKRPDDVYHVDDIEQASDQLVWSVDVGPPIAPRRPQDRTIVGNVVEAMLAYAEGKLGEPAIPLGRAARIIAIGSDRMMAAVARARHGVLGPHLDPCHVGIGSINSTMQCMMKEVCAQCLQKHRDPRTGEESFVFTCFSQDQPLDRVDWRNLATRLKTNSVQEKLTNLWLDHLLSRAELPRV